ncbi:MAG: TlpA disulfide reductase family protein [Rickettsiales bacterium]
MRAIRVLILILMQAYWGCYSYANENFKPSNNFVYDLKLHSADGSTYKLDKFAGNVLVLHFWASWCSNCKQEMLELDAFQNKYSDKPVIVIPISEDFKGIEVVNGFYKKNEITNLLSFIDLKNQIFADMRVNGLPTTIIIDSLGNEVARTVGKVNWSSKGLIGYLLSFHQPKPTVNQDYQELMDKYKKTLQPNTNEENAEVTNEHLPKNAVTTLEPLEIEENFSDNKLPQEIKVTNPEHSDFSLKIRRPLNKKE